jgi:hypothetical protein
MTDSGKQLIIIATDSRWLAELYSKRKDEGLDGYIDYLLVLDFFRVHTELATQDVNS